MAKAKLTKKKIEAVKPDSARDVWVWDTDVKSFGVRVKPSGVRIYLIQYRDTSRRTRRYSIGQHGQITVDQARTKAQKLFGQIADGANPAAERKQAALRGTVEELAVKYLAEYARPRKKPRSIEEDERNLKLHVLPRIGKLRADLVTHEDIEKMHTAMRETATAANRCLSLVSTMFTCAERWHWRPPHTNPAQHVEEYREQPRERYLSPKELERLGTALEEFERSVESEPLSEKQRTRRRAEVQSAALAIRLLILTGARRDEILGLRWEWVDLERGCLHLPDSKTGAKKIRLNAPACVLLEHAPSVNEYVIPGRDGKGRLVNLSKAWARMCQLAEIKDLHIHDLRHSFASVGAAGGLSLLVIGKLLTHKQASTTQRYSHLADDAIAAASEVIGSRIAAALEGKPDADVIQLPIR